MAVTRAEKEQELADLSSAFKAADTAILVDYKGLNVPQVTELRRQIRAARGQYRVVKNTLVRRAVADTPFAALGERMVGPMAYGIGTDPVAVAKVLNDFAKGNDKFVIAGGAMPGQVMSPKEIAALATLPSRDDWPMTVPLFNPPPASNSGASPPQ